MGPMNLTAMRRQLREIVRHDSAGNLIRTRLRKETTKDGSGRRVARGKSTKTLAYSSAELERSCTRHCIR